LISETENKMAVMPAMLKANTTMSIRRLVIVLNCQRQRL